MQWPGHLTFTLRLGEGYRHVPNHLDYVLGATRPASSLDGGPVDGAVRKWGGAGEPWECSLPGADWAGRASTVLASMKRRNS